MRDYIPQKDKYWMPRDRYLQAKYAVKSYERLQTEYRELLYRSTTASGRGGRVSDPTAYAGERRKELGDRLTAIDRAFAQIPEEYRQGVLDHIRYGGRYPCTAGEATWARWTRRVLYCVAKYLNIP